MQQRCPMRSRLLILRRFTHDPQSVLATVYWFALVGDVLCYDVGVRIRTVRLELSIAAFTYADEGRRMYLYEAQTSLRHDRSLAQECASGTLPTTILGASIVYYCPNLLLENLAIGNMTDNIYGGPATCGDTRQENVPVP
jgi:hypothetical protein